MVENAIVSDRWTVRQYNNIVLGEGVLHRVVIGAESMIVPLFPKIKNVFQGLLASIVWMLFFQLAIMRE